MNDVLDSDYIMDRVKVVAVVAFAVIVALRLCKRSSNVVDIDSERNLDDVNVDRINIRREARNLSEIVVL